METTRRPHQALQILLFCMAVLIFIGGLTSLFATAWMLSMAYNWFGFAPISLDFLLVKGFGILALALAYLCYVAAHDPVRYVGVVDALAFILIAAGGLDIYGYAVLHMALFASWIFIVRAGVRLALGIALLALRPRGVE